MHVGGLLLDSKDAILKDGATKASLGHAVKYRLPMRGDFPALRRAKPRL